MMSFLLLEVGDIVNEFCHFYFKFGGIGRINGYINSKFLELCNQSIKFDSLACKREENIFFCM